MDCRFCDEIVTIRGSDHRVVFVELRDRLCRDCLIMFGIIPINIYNSKDWELWLGVDFVHGQR